MTSVTGNVIRPGNKGNSQPFLVLPYDAQGRRVWMSLKGSAANLRFALRPDYKVQRIGAVVSVPLRFADLAVALGVMQQGRGEYRAAARLLESALNRHPFAKHVRKILTSV